MSHDPLESLRRPDRPVAPRPEFAEALRRSLEKELHMPSTDRPATPTPSFRALQPSLSVDGGAAAIEFYERAFGATVTLRIEADSGKIGHAELQIGDVRFTLADEYPDLGFVSPTSLGGTPVMLRFEVDDVDAAFERAVTAGATAERPPENQFHGNRTATVVDPFGHRWTFMAPAETLTIEELAARAAEEGFTTTTSDPPPEP